MAGPYYVDVTTGNDGDDGLSEANAFATLKKAADTVAAGEIVYVKASASYVVQDGANDCVMQITTAGTVYNEPIVWIGYTTIITDKGVVTIDADTNTLASAVKTAIGGVVMNQFINFRFTGGSGDGFDANGVIDDNIIFINCQFDNNDGWGLQGDNSFIFYKCIVNNNGSGAIDVDINLVCIGCKAYTNTGNVFIGSRGVALWNLLYDNGANKNITFNDTGGIAFIIGNTIDGENVGLTGIHQDNFNNFLTIILNNIIHDLDVGIISDATNAYCTISDYNLFNSNTTDRTNIAAGDNDVAAVPDFEDEGTRDYRIKATSSAYKAGFDAGEI